MQLQVDTHKTGCIASLRKATKSSSKEEEIKNRCITLGLSSVSKMRSRPDKKRDSLDDYICTVSDSCSKTEVQQQVLEKLKNLSLRIKTTREEYSCNTGKPLNAKHSKLESTVHTKKATKNALTNNAWENEKEKEKLISKALSKSASNNDKVEQQQQQQQSLSKSRRQLEAEVYALHNLLNQLCLQSPQLKSVILSIAKNIPELKHNEIFGLSRLEGGSEREFQCPSTSKKIKAPPRDQLVHVKMREGEAPSAANARVRKRGNRGGKKSCNNKKRKSQANELRDLCKYINGIVEEYLNKNESNNASLRSLVPKFEGGFDELKGYAEQLVNFGLGRIVEDELRINRKNNRQSFITMSNDRETMERDGMIMLPVARRYAFEGDIVQAFVFHTSANTDNDIDKSSDADKSVCKDDQDETYDDSDVLEGGCETPDSDLDSNELEAVSPTLTINCPKAFVVDIIKHTDDRKVVGAISFKNAIQLSDDAAAECSYFKFKPLDARMPLMFVPEKTVRELQQKGKVPNEITDLLFLGQICETDVNGHCIAELVQLLGKVGHLGHELKAILLHNGFKDLKPFDKRFINMFKDQEIPSTAKDQRMDLRKDCIFTIDPLTARDLDDAVSIEKIPNSTNQYKVGVHIADVAHFLAEDTELDNEVKMRATSIYLVNEVIHMLPETLCYSCSLLPGQDKLAVSVFWQMDIEGNVIGKPQFARSIINSCTQLAYLHAQKLIEDENAESKPESFPNVHNGFTLANIAESVRTLNKMAQCMRIKRFENGALSINNPKLRFELHPLNGEPLAYDIERSQEANHMIEEFMLLANMTVAKQIYTSFPEVAVLRSHAPPLMTAMKNLQERLLTLGVNLDINSSKTVYESLLRICREANDPKAMNACLSTMLTKPMARAKYFCSDGKSESEMWHYALSIPLYTHFTSPIRRYPDILVHRLLAASLNYCPAPRRTVEELEKIVDVCNTNKYNAKCASEESSFLYFKHYVKSCQGINMRAVVLEIHQHLANVVTVETGHVFPIQYKAQKVIVDKQNVPSYIQILEKGSMQPPLKLKIFSPVDIKLVVREEKLVAFFVSPDLRQRQLNCIESSGYRQKNSVGKERKLNRTVVMPQAQNLEQKNVEVINKNVTAVAPTK